MSRIHEALKKAEQERAMSQAGSRVETTPAAVEVAEAAVAAAPALGALPGFSANSESLITRTRQTQWSPDTNCMARASSRPVQTFSIGFGKQDFDEAKYARAVAQRFGTEHHDVARTGTMEGRACGQRCYARIAGCESGAFRRQ